MPDKPSMIVCSECGGKGATACPACRGQGRKPSSTAMTRPCMSCHGRGTVVCPVCRGAKKVEK